MDSRSKSSATAVWLVAAGIGLLFLARGAFQPYIFPLFEHLGGFSYGPHCIATQRVRSRAVSLRSSRGWYTRPHIRRVALGTSNYLWVGKFPADLEQPGFLVSTAAVLRRACFRSRENLSEYDTVLHSSAETLRRLRGEAGDLCGQ